MHTDLKKTEKKSHRRMRLKMQLDASLFMKKIKLTLALLQEFPQNAFYRIKNKLQKHTL